MFFALWRTEVEQRIVSCQEASSRPSDNYTMQLANFSDEAGKQIYRHLRN